MLVPLLCPHVIAGMTIQSLHSQHKTLQWANPSSYFHPLTQLNPLMHHSHPITVQSNSLRSEQRDTFFIFLICVHYFVYNFVPCSLSSTRRLVRIINNYEKRDHMQNAILFCNFSNCHHYKASRALGFWLGLLAVWAFYFTDPLEATCISSLLSLAVSR